MHVNILIKEIRKEKNISLTALSRRTGVSVTHLNDIENNKKMPSVIVMILAAKALDVPITELYKVNW